MAPVPALILGNHRGLGNHGGVPLRRRWGLSLPDVVHRFKTMTTKRYIDGVKQHGWPRFNGKLWQRNYHEHIVRDDNESHRIREYIADNPKKWELDNNNPNRHGKNTIAEPQPQYGHEPWMV